MASTKQKLHSWSQSWDEKVDSTNERVLLLDLAQACVWVTFSINSTVKITFSKDSTVKIPNLQVLCIAFCKQSNGVVGLSWFIPTT